MGTKYPAVSGDVLPLVDKGQAKKPFSGDILNPVAGKINLKKNMLEDPNKTSQKTVPKRKNMLNLSSQAR